MLLLVFAVLFWLLSRVKKLESLKLLEDMYISTFKDALLEYGGKTAMSCIFFQPTIRHQLDSIIKSLYNAIKDPMYIWKNAIEYPLLHTVYFPASEVFIVSSLTDPCQELRDVKLDILCKSAIITGGGSGIGFASAYELLNNGAKFVILAHPDEEKGRKAAQCLCDQFGMHKAKYFACDIRCSKQFEDVFLNAKKCCNKVDILLNNAGVLDDKNWEHSIQTNVIGTIQGILLANKHMKGNNSVVINTAAIAGLVPWPNLPIFAASKHAVVTASRCFGHPFHYDKTNIRVIGLCPSFTDTPTWERGINKHLELDWGKQTLTCLCKIRMQPAAIVAKAIVHLIKYGKSGKIYVCDQGVLHRAAFPREEDVLQPEPLCQNH